VKGKKIMKKKAGKKRAKKKVVKRKKVTKKKVAKKKVVKKKSVKKKVTRKKVAKRKATKKKVAKKKVAKRKVVKKKAAKKATRKKVAKKKVARKKVVKKKTVKKKAVKKKVAKKAVSRKKVVKKKTAKSKSSLLGRVASKILKAATQVVSGSKPEAKKKKARKPSTQKPLTQKPSTQKALTQKPLTQKKKAVTKKAARAGIAKAKIRAKRGRKSVGPEQVKADVALKDIEKQATAFIEKGTNEGVLTYEAIALFVKKHKLSEGSLDELLDVLEKENVDLVSMEELQTTTADYSKFAQDEKGASFGTLKNNLESSIEQMEISDETSGRAEEPKEVAKLKYLMEVPQLNDPVKLYLKEIGKIPLLNKITEKIIANKIAQGKIDSIDAISKFPFVSKDLFLIAERLENDPLFLKDVIQF